MRRNYPLCVPSLMLERDGYRVLKQWTGFEFPDPLSVTVEVDGLYLTLRLYRKTRTTIPVFDRDEIAILSVLKNADRRLTADEIAEAVEREMSASTARKKLTRLRKLGHVDHPRKRGGFGVPGREYRA